MEYKTSDIYFSSFLCALDVPLERTEIDETTGKGKMVFVFTIPEKDLSRLKASYFGGSGNVKALKFVERLRSLKSMVFV